MLFIDVRTPAEFEKGHRPGAVNVPLFTNEERHDVGLLYKEEGPQKAVRLGLSLVGPKMHSLVDEVDRITGGPSETPLSVYCWRGGQRSGSMAWLLETAGYTVYKCLGGYKAYRQEVLQRLAAERPYRVLTGSTGVGKTEWLHLLKEHFGFQIIDLEGLANHRGSAFGHLGQEKQPTSEQFENTLDAALSLCDPLRPIWLEDESQLIGKVWMSHEFYTQLGKAPRLKIDRIASERAAYLAEIYGSAEPEKLKEVFLRLARKIGGQNVAPAHLAIDEGRWADAAELALHYYDKTYQYSLEKKEIPPVASVDISGLDQQTALQSIAQESLKLPFQ